MVRWEPPHTPVHHPPPTTHSPPTANPPTRYQPSGVEKRGDQLARAKALLTLVALASRAARSEHLLRVGRTTGGGAERRAARREAKLEHARSLARLVVGWLVSGWLRRVYCDDFSRV